MARQKHRQDGQCPVARSLEQVGDAWSLLIVRNAFDGMRRYGEFLDDLGIARNILADRLRRLVEAGILEQVAAADGGSHSEYALTRRGKDLFPVIVGLRQWGEAHLYGKGERHSKLVARADGKPLPPMRPLGRDGRPLEADDTLVKRIA